MMLVAAMLLSSAGIFANDAMGDDPKKELKSQIHRLLDGYYELPSGESKAAVVLFTVNNENEIVVLSVQTDDQALEDLVKARLNYHKMESTALAEGRRYTVPVKFVG